MFSSAITFAACIPFILAINLPAYSYTTGNPFYFWLALGVTSTYMLLGLLCFRFIARSRAFQSPSLHWLPQNIMN